MNRAGGRGGGKTQKEKKVKEQKKQGRTQRQGNTRETKETHIDTGTRTTGNKSGACVRGHTKDYLNEWNLWCGISHLTTRFNSIQTIQNLE